MTDTNIFLDTNILLYLLSDNAEKATKVEQLLQQKPVISVQVLNEITNVTRRKFAMSWADIKEFLHLIQSFCSVEPVTLHTHRDGLKLAERYQLSTYDAMIISSAVISKCNILYTEDMQNGLRIHETLQLRNPFCS